MTSTTSERRTFLGMSAMHWALVVLIIIASAAGGFALAERTDQRDTAEASRDAVAGKSQELVECVKGPQVDCQAEADTVEKTIDDANASIPGPAGAQGVEGPTGPQGAQGPVGPQGPTGARGLIGQVGPRGVPGEDGADGPPGPAGGDGMTGATGETGPVGPAGAQGPKGEPGSDGAPGPAGPAGEQGQPGPAAGSFTFTYLGTTYRCADPDGDGAYDCEPT